jgi:hypothetical protein
LSDMGVQKAPWSVSFLVLSCPRLSVLFLFIKKARVSCLVAFDLKV